MKRLFLVLLFIFSISTYAQITPSYGLKIGLGITNHSWEYQPPINGKLDWDNNYGVSIRAFADVAFSNIFGVGGEIGYSQKGIRKTIPVTTVQNPDGIGESINITNKLDYLSFSLMGKIKIETDLLSPYILIGPQYNRLLSSNIAKGFEIVYDHFEKDIFSITVGLGSEFQLFSINALLEYRYERDISNSSKLSTIEIKNYSHIFLVGIKL
jgi:hypothetical protein